MTRRYWIFATSIFGIVIIAAASLSLLMHERALEELHNSSQEKLSVLSDALHNAIGPYEPIPTLIGEGAAVRALVENPSEPRLVDGANRFLERMTGVLSVAYIYVLDPDGRTIAASNWAAPDSFVGHDYSFRPYYRDAK